MTSQELAPESPLSGASEIPLGEEGRRGGPARRVMVRWSVRMFRREWRRQGLVLALLIVAVTMMVAGMAASYNLVPFRDAEFGGAEHVASLDGSDPEALAADLDVAADLLGPVEVISQYPNQPVPGSSTALEVRGQDPSGPLGGPMLDLVAGRYPASTNEVAVTAAAADLLDVAVGQGSVPVGGDRDLTVVGLVENPSNLDDEFLLVAPSYDQAAESVNLLVASEVDDSQLFAFEESAQTDRSLVARGQTESSTAAAAALGVATVLLMLVGLVAAAGFVVVAHRRLRQLGMLAAVGATDRHLRLAMLANGVIVGIVATLAGTIAGLVLWAAAAPSLEATAQHRIEILRLPSGMIGLGGVLAVLVAGAAAWWPARSVSRLAVTRALSARPPRPRPVWRSAVLAAALIGAGVVALVVGGPVNALAIIGGTLAVVGGVLLLCPAAIRLLTVPANRSPVAGRLALRDLVRRPTRSGAALASITLGVGIAVGIVVVAAASVPAASEGNLSDRQLLIRMGEGETFLVPVRDPAEIERLDQTVVDLTGRLGDGTEIVPLDMPVDPEVEPERSDSGGVVQVAVMLSEPVGGTNHGHELYVATPELLAYLGVDVEGVEPGVDVLAVDRDQIWPNDDRAPTGPVELEPPYEEGLGPAQVQPLDVSGYTSSPIAVMLPSVLEREGWVAARSSWLVEAAAPLTEAQLDQVRETAAQAGLTVEVRDDHASIRALRWGATGVGALLALGILALTVGLVRSDAADDVRALAAAGAAPRIRRAVTAITTGALAFLAAVLGCAATYLAAGAGYGNDLGRLGEVPVGELAVILAGMPLVATAAAWLLAGREPPTLARGRVD